MKIVWRVLCSLLMFASVALQVAPAAGLAEPTTVVAVPPEMSALLDAHNRWREEAHMPPLTWSDAAAGIAQHWANELASRDCQPGRSKGDPQKDTWGENVYSYWRSGAYEGYHKTPEFVVDRWASERAWFERQTSRCSAPKGNACAHYQQMVSMHSTQVGCGRARCAAAEVWVCSYGPPISEQRIFQSLGKAK